MNYVDKKIQKKAEELIKLKLLYFKLKSLEPISTKQKSEKSVKKKQKKSKVFSSDTKIESGQHWHYSSLYGKNIIEAGKALRVSKNTIRRELESVGVKIDDNETLSKDAVKKIRYFIIKRIKRIQGKRWTRAPRLASQMSENAFERVQEFSVGRMIYIRN